MQLSRLAGLLCSTMAVTAAAAAVTIDRNGDEFFYCVLIIAGLAVASLDRGHFAGLLVGGPRSSLHCDVRC